MREGINFPLSTCWTTSRHCVLLRPQYRKGIEKMEKKMLGAGALDLFSLEKRLLQVDLIAACQEL